MSRRRVLSGLNHVLVSSVVLSVLVPVTVGQANVTGKWSTLSYTMPINPIHAALLAMARFWWLPVQEIVHPRNRVAPRVHLTDPRMARERCC